MVAFYHIPGSINPADILSKHWGHSQVYPMLRPMLFYCGNTLDLITQEDDANDETAPSAKGGERQVSHS